MDEGHEDDETCCKICGCEDLATGGAFACGCAYDNEDDEEDINDWLYISEEEAEKLNKRSQAAKEKDWDRKRRLAQLVCKQAKCFAGVPLLFHGTGTAKKILDDGWFAGRQRYRDVTRREECVCFTRDPWIASKMAFGWLPRDSDRTFIPNSRPTVLILDRNRLRTRYKIHPFVDKEIWHDACDGERYETCLKVEAEERIYAPKVLLKHGLLAVIEVPKWP